MLLSNFSITFEGGLLMKNTRLYKSVFLASALCAGAVQADEKNPNIPAMGESPSPQVEKSSDGPSAAELEKIAKMTANPIGAAWMLWTQNDYTRIRGDAVPGSKNINSTKFQPVMSFPVDIFDEDWNLIVRPVLQYQNVPLRKSAGDLFGNSLGEITNDVGLSSTANSAFDGRTDGLGDTALLTLLGPNRLDGFVWGAGLTQIFPTAKEDVLGQDKWQAGPAVLLAHMAPDVGGWNVGALGQHWWSYAGDDDREDTSQTDIQYFINYRLSSTELIGMSPNIRYNWKADSDNKLTLPVGLGYSNVYKVGKLPLRVAAEVQYSVVSPDNVGSDWNFRLLFIPVISNPFR
jgi:hypothetical protein